MFNGIIKHTGKIYKIYKDSKNCYVQVLSNIKFTSKEIGSSISCSGVCLTLDKVVGKKIFLLVQRNSKKN